MDTSPILVIHLIELINETHTLIGKNLGPGLEGPLPRDGATLDVCSESHRRGPLARGLRVI